MLFVKQQSILADGARFLVAGGINTLISLAVYQAALFISPPTVAYGVAWLSGLIFLVIFYPQVVFPRGNNSPKHRALLALSYLTIFLAGLLLLRFIVAYTAAPRVAIFAAVACTTTLNFFCSRAILRHAK